MEREIEKESIEKVDKNKVKKYRIVIIILSSIIGILIILIASLTTMLSKENIYCEYHDKISIRLHNENKDFSSADEMVKGKYGINFAIELDAKKHPKYNEWLKSNDINEESFKSLNNSESEYNETINKEFYETIKNFFSNLKYEISKRKYIVFDYEIYEDTDEKIIDAKNKMNDIMNSFFKSNTYKYCVELAKEDYISMITIVLYSPKSVEE